MQLLAGLAALTVTFAAPSLALGDPESCNAGAKTDGGASYDLGLGWVAALAALNLSPVEQERVHGYVVQQRTEEQAEAQNDDRRARVVDELELVDKIATALSARNRTKFERRMAGRRTSCVTSARP